MCHPVEIAAIDHTSAHLGGMAVHILRGGMGDDVASPLKRTAVNGRGKGVVHDEWYAVAVGYACKLLYVKHLAAGNDVFTRKKEVTNYVEL